MHSGTNLRAVGLFVTVILLQFPPANAAPLIKIDARNLIVTVDAATCRWSAEVKGTPMRLNDAFFLPNDDPSGWTVVSSVNQNDSSKVSRGYCSHKVTMPSGKSFDAEKLLIALRAMEHQADLIAIAHDARLKQRRPIDLNDQGLVANNYSRFHGWMSGGNGVGGQGCGIEGLLLTGPASGRGAQGRERSAVGRCHVPDSSGLARAGYRRRAVTGKECER